MERRLYELEVRALDDDQGTFEGYASVFGNVDTYGTVMQKGAFKRSINANKGKFPLLRFHNPDAPIGMVEAEEDEKGLRVRGVIDLDTQNGREVFSGIKKGYIDRMSVGFNRIKEKVVEGVTHLTEVRLWEVSTITRNFAANDMALVTDVRVDEQILDELRKMNALLGKRDSVETTPDEEDSHDEADSDSPQGAWEDELRLVAAKLKR